MRKRKEKIVVTSEGSRVLVPSGKVTEEEAIDLFVQSEGMEPIREALEHRDWLTDDEVDIMMNAFMKEQAPRLKCEKCGYVWIADPRKWRGEPKEDDMAKIHGKHVKILFCPSCGRKVYVHIDMALYIWTWWTNFLREWKRQKEEERTKRQLDAKAGVS